MSYVKFLSNQEDLRIALLGSLGFSTKYIQSECGMTPCQIGYRLRKAEVRRADYRNGENELAAMVMRKLNGAAENKVRQKIVRLKLR